MTHPDIEQCERTGNNNILPGEPSIKLICGLCGMMKDSMQEYDEGLDKHFCDAACQIEWYQRQHALLTDLTVNLAAKSTVLACEPYKEYRTIPKENRWYIHVSYIVNNAIIGDVLTGTTREEVIEALDAFRGAIS